MTIAARNGTLVGVVVAAACAPDLPPALGDRVTDSALEVVEASGSEWVIGERLSLSDLEGKPIVLDFWASSCGACALQHEYVAGLEATYGDQIEVVGVLFDDTLENVATGPNSPHHDSVTARLEGSSALEHTAHA